MASLEAEVNPVKFHPTKGSRFFFFFFLFSFFFFSFFFSPLVRPSPPSTGQESDFFSYSNLLRIIDRIDISIILLIPVGAPPHIAFTQIILSIPPVLLLPLACENLSFLHRPSSLSPLPFELFLPLLSK